MHESRLRALTEARYYISIRRFPQARRLLLDLLAEEPRSPELLFLLAVCEYSLDHYDEAEQLCRQVRAYGDPDDPRAEALLGRIALQREDYPTAERHLLAALRMDPQDASNMALYAQVLLKAGHEKKARQVLEEALRLDPENEVVLQVRYLFHQAKGQLQGELEALERYMIHGSNEVNKLLTAARTAIFRGRHREARELVREAFLLNPTDQELLSILRHMEVEGHPLMAPLRWVSRVGGPGAVWIGAMLIGFGSRALGWVEFAAAFALLYLLFALYTWVVPPLLRRYYGAR
ncbi:MAG: tetratricopeptide repeat protein [Bacillota bacterium]